MGDALFLLMVSDPTPIALVNMVFPPSNIQFQVEILSAGIALFHI
jgi:hypothetical protein